MPTLQSFPGALHLLDWLLFFLKDSFPRFCDSIPTGPSFNLPLISLPPVLCLLLLPAAQAKELYLPRSLPSRYISSLLHTAFLQQ